MSLKMISTPNIPAYTGYFEAHITVQSLTEIASKHFLQLCNQLQVKGIQIELSRGSHAVQPMTCSRHKGSFDEIYIEVLELAKKLEEENFKVVRLKIEAHPDNDNVPRVEEEVHLHSNKNYFEHHLKVRLHSSMDRASLLAICKKHQAHLSKNAYKKMENGWYDNFITMRSYNTSKQAAQLLFNALIFDIKTLDIQIHKQFMEYCVYDNNIGLDDNWLVVSPCASCDANCMKNQS